MRKDFKNEKSGDVSSNYNAGNDSRAENEAMEGHATQSKDAPDNRYQTKQQIVPVAEAMDADTPKTGFQKRKQKTSGSQVKQEVASRVMVADSDFAGAGYFSPSGAGLRSLSFSGDSGTIIGSAANTPSVGVTDRNGNNGRFERKLDAPNKKINFTASEQVIEEYDNPLPLGQSGNEKQGYYGTPKNTSARSQKASGAHPGDPLYQRSLDVITRDEVVFIQGQYIKQDGVHYDDVPTVSSSFSQGVRTETPIDIEAGNFLPRELTVTLSKASSGSPFVKGFHFTDVIDASINNAEASVANRSSANYIIDINKAEIARANIDSKAGDETKPEWSDLARAIPQPTQTNFLLSAIESEIGATVATAYKFGSKAYAYQLNKSAKDGQHLTRPVREMITGDIADYLTSQDFATGGLYAFDPLDDSADAIAARRNGSAATLILLNDSKGKYTNKGMYLTSPKGLRQYFQIADNNMNVFRLKKLFGAALNNVDVFSTIDRAYDPLQPVLMTDKLALVYAINPEKYASFDRADATSARTYAQGAGYLTYSYANRMSNYTIRAVHPLWDGIATFIEQHANKFYSVLGGGASGDIEWRIPIHHSTSTFALFDFLVMAAVPYIQRSRINAMRDVIDYEENFGYPYDLISIKEFNPTNAVNYIFNDIDSPLVCKQMIPSMATSWVMPEFFWGLGRNTSSANASMYVAPWYFNEHDFHAIADGTSGDNSGFEYDDFGGNMSMPVIRSGVRLSYLDSLYSMSERDIRLSLDRMTVLPGTRVAGTNSYAVYKYSQVSDGIPAFKGGFTVGEYLKTPRELGWFMTAPHGLLRCADNKTNVSALTNAGAGLLHTRKAAANDDATSDTSYRAYTWYGKTNYDESVLDVASINVDRAQAFSQNWDCSPAARMARRGQTVSGYKVRRDIGFLLSINQLGTVGTGSSVSLIDNAGSFHPFTTGLNASGGYVGAQKALTATLFTALGLAKGLWGRLQRLPMVLSPWDTCDFAGSDGGDQFDPYDLAYAFGMAGTMASDYTEDLYDRLNVVQNQGWLFIEDPFVADSPVFKDGLKYTV